jgi:ML domain
MSPLQEGAYADVTVKLGVVKLLTKEFDLCEEAYVFLVLPIFAIPTGFFSRRNAQLEVQCPVKRGDYLVEHTVVLPKEIPQGELSSFSSMLPISFFWLASAKFNVNAHGYTVDDDELFCVDLTINFFKKPFPKLF